MIWKEYSNPFLFQLYEKTGVFGVLKDCSYSHSVFAVYFCVLVLYFNSLCFKNLHCWHAFLFFLLFKMKWWNISEISLYKR